MMGSPDPRFSVGQRVANFRGEPATVDNVQKVDTPGKSHRVSVTWDDPGDGPHKDNVAYYEEVFEPLGAAYKVGATMSGGEPATPPKPRKTLPSAIKRT